MGRSLSAVGRDESEDGGSCKEFFDMVDELQIVSENISKSLAVSDVEQCPVTGNRSRDLKARESEVSNFGGFGLGRFNSILGESREIRLKEERLDEQLKSVTEHIELLEARLKDAREKRHEVESKERDVELMRELLGKKSKEIEMREFEKLCKIEKREKEIGVMQESLSGKYKEVEKREKEIGVMQESLSGKLKEVEKRQKELEFIPESISRKMSEVEKREKEIGVMQESLSGKLKEVEKRQKELEYMRESSYRKLSEVEKREKETMFMQESLREKLKEIGKREKDIEFMCGSLDGKLKDVEKREKEIEFMHGSLRGKLKDVENREKDVSVLRGKLKELVKRESQVDNMRESLERQLRGVENREREVEALSEKLIRAEKNEKELKFLQQKLCDLEKREREVKDMRGSLDTRSREVERREREVESLQEKLIEVEKKEKEYEDKHRLLDRRLREAERRAKEIEILDEKLKNVEERERKVEVARESIDGRLQEVERRETEVELLHEKFENVEKRAKEVDLMHASVEGRLKEVENLEKEAKVLFEKSKDIENLEKVVETMHASLQRRLIEVEESEREFVLSQNARMKDLVSKEQALNTKRDTFAKVVEAANEKLKLGSHLIGKLDNALVTLDHMKSTVNDRFKEMESWEATTYESLSLMLNKAVLAREMAEKQLVELENRETISSKEKTKEDLLQTFLASYKLQHDSVCSSRNAGPNMEQIGHLRNCEGKDEQCTVAGDAHAKLNPVERIEVKNQEHETEEHMELTSDEINKVLLLSSDAAKLVLEAIHEFYSSHLVKGDVEFKLWRKYLRLLNQFQKLSPSPSINPCVTEAANKLFFEWKPRAIMYAHSECMVLGFLLFVAIYNLTPCLAVEEVLTLLKRVAHWKDAPKLLHKLCSSEIILDFIQNLVKENKYLLASAFIDGCKSQDMFPQSVVLNNFLTHSTMLAKEIRRRGNNSSEAQVEAIDVEISHLNDAIKHIKKFGLESELSPQGLEARIQKFERSKVALTKHLMRTTSFVSNREPFPAPKNSPITSAAEVSSSSLVSDARFSQNGNSRKRPPPTTDSTSLYDRWLLEMNGNDVSHVNGYNAQRNWAHKKSRRANHVPRPGVPHGQQRTPGDYCPNL